MTPLHRRELRRRAVEKARMQRDMDRLAARFDSMPASIAKEEVRVCIILGRKRVDEWDTVAKAPIHEWMAANKHKLPSGSI